MYFDVIKNMLYKDLFGYISIALVFIAAVPYLLGIYRGKIRPHIFTWVIWGVVAFISALARTVAEGGPGTWAQWSNVAFCLGVVLFSLSKKKHNVKRSDVIVFIIALSAIPFWIITNNPLVAVIIVTTIDIIAYYPTFRKSYEDPHHEAVFNYFGSNIIQVLSLIAIESYSLTTTLFPLATLIANSGLIAFIFWRRYQIVK